MEWYIHTKTKGREDTTTHTHAHTRTRTRACPSPRARGCCRRRSAVVVVIVMVIVVVVCVGGGSVPKTPTPTLYNQPTTHPPTLPPPLCALCHCSPGGTSARRAAGGSLGRPRAGGGVRPRPSCRTRRPCTERSGRTGSAVFWGVCVCWEGLVRCGGGER